MSEALALAQSPLQTYARPGLYGSKHGPTPLLVSEVRGRALVGVMARRGLNETLQAKVRDRFGIEMPSTPRLAIGTQMSFLWAGHEQWLSIAEEKITPDLPSMLNRELGQLASVVDHSDARAWIRLCGPAARATLAKLAPIDFHPRVFRPHDTALTVMEYIPVQITQLDEQPSYEISAPRSFAESFWHGLIQAASEFGIRVVP